MNLRIYESISHRIENPELTLSFLEFYLKLNICSLDQLDKLLRRNFGSQEVIVDGDSSTVLHTFLVTLRDAAHVFAGVLSEQVEI